MFDNDGLLYRLPMTKDHIIVTSEFLDEKEKKEPVKTLYDCKITTQAPYEGCIKDVKDEALFVFFQ